MSDLRGLMCRVMFDEFVAWEAVQVLMAAVEGGSWVVMRMEAAAAVV
jgi:hypothetical protein